MTRSHQVLLKTKNIKNFKFLLVLSLVFAFVILQGCSSSASSNYPTKPINMLVGFDPGSTSDTSARMIAQFGEKHLDETITIVNKFAKSQKLQI